MQSTLPGPPEGLATVTRTRAVAVFNAAALDEFGAATGDALLSLAQWHSRGRRAALASNGA